MITLSVPELSSLGRCVLLLSGALIALCLLSLGGCGDEAPPDAGTMTLREFLGMTPERAAELDRGAREALAARLFERWREEHDAAPLTPAYELSDPDVDAPAESAPLRFIQLADAQRTLAGEDVAVAARLELDDDAAHGQLRPGIAAPVDLGLVLAGGLALGEDPEDAPPMFPGALLYDDAWGRVDVEALDDRSELDAITSLEPLIRRFLTLADARGVNVQIFRAPQAPLLMWYAQSHRALLINPNLLLLLATASAATRTQRWRLTPAFVSSCAVAHRDRCDGCLGANGASTSCEPLFSQGDPDPATRANAECEALAEDGGQGFELYCYNQYVNASRMCFVGRDTSNRCGAEGGPYESVEGLDALTPMLEDDFCHDLLTSCRDDVPSVDSAPPTVEDRDEDGGSDEDSGLGDLLDGCSGCSGSSCSGFDGCGELGSCAGDGLGSAGSCGSCAGDGLSASDAEDDDEDDDDVWGGRAIDGASAPPWTLLLSFTMLAGLWWRERRAGRRMR